MMIKTSTLWTVVGLGTLLFNNGCSSAVAVDVDFSDRTIVSISQKTSLLEDVEEEGVVSSLSTADDLTESLSEVSQDEECGKRIHMLSLSKTAMDDAAFAEVTDRFVGKVHFEDDDGILDLSFNGLTPLSTPHLMRWINEAGVKFVNVHGNPNCSMRYVGDLCKFLLKTSPQMDEATRKRDVQKSMSHIVFLPKHYIYQAKTRVKIYRQLQEKGYLPDNWDGLQRDFYVALAKGKPVSFPETVFDKDPDADFPFED